MPIGMKSFLSLERSAIFTCRKNGVERKYLVYEGAEFVNFDLIYTKETNEENGVKAELVIASRNERVLFEDKAKGKLAYYDTAVLIIDNNVIVNEIHRNELFQWSDLCPNANMHLCLKDVYYTIDWEALGIPPIDIPVAIRLQLGDGLTPTPSRESYITNEKTKELLLSRISAIAKWFMDKYNDRIKIFDSFMDAYNYLGITGYYITLEGKTFYINPLFLYHKKGRINPVNVKGITVRDPNDYKMRKGRLLEEYSPVGYINYSGVMKNKEGRMGVNKEYHVFNDRNVTVLVGENFRGNLKTFLKEKYGCKTLFLRRNNFVRPLGKQTPKGQMKIDVESYRSMLDLGTKPKNVWRFYIEEWNFVVSSVISTFRDETKTDTSKEFQEWIEERKEEQREKRKNNPSMYTGLGKQVGDVTLAYSYIRHGHYVHFRKEAFPIADLHKNKFLTVLFHEEDTQVVKEMVMYMKNDNVKFALAGKKEIQKVPKHYQFINLQDFMKIRCKPFTRIASTMRFQEVLDDYNRIANYKNPVFKKALKVLKSDADALAKYVQKHSTYTIGDNLKNVILDAASQCDLYDKELWAEYTRLKEGVRKYDFIKLFTVPAHTNYELTERYEKLINQILLFRKKYYNDLPDGAKIIFEEPETKTKTETNEVV